MTAFRVRYSHDGVAWNRITTEDGGRERVFPGNHDAESENVVYFPRPLRARYLRLTPLTWHGGVGVRAEVLGCDNQYCEFSTSEAIHNTYYYSSLRLSRHFFSGDRPHSGHRPTPDTRILRSLPRCSGVGPRRLPLRPGAPLGRGEVRGQGAVRLLRRFPQVKQERDPFTDLRRLLHFKVQT